MGLITKYLLYKAFVPSSTHTIRQMVRRQNRSNENGHIAVMLILSIVVICYLLGKK